MKENIKIAILDMYDSYPNEGMRCIKMLLGEFLAKDGIKGNYDVFDVRGKEELPEIEDYDIYISTGGPGSPIVEGHRWEGRFFNFLDQVRNYNKVNSEKKFVFLICHSFQLAVQHFELGTVCERRSTSFGVMPIHKVNEDVLFETLEDPFWAVDSRDYQVIEPRNDEFERLGASILALEKERPHVPLERAVMAIRFSDEIFGVQFHPEADAEGMRRYFLQEDKKLAVIKEHGEEKYNDMIEHLDDPDKIMYTESVIIPKFLENAYQSFQHDLSPAY